MSIKLMSECWERRFEQRSDREVMLVLCDYANDEGICWPSRDAVAWKTDLSQTTLKAVYKRLREAEALEVLGNERGGRGIVPILRVNPYALPEKPPRERGEPAIPLLEKRGEVSSLRGREAASPKGGKPLTPEPLESPSVEPPVVVGEKLDPLTERCLGLLREVRGFTRDENHIAKKIAEYRQQFPGADPVEVCQDFKAVCEESQKSPTMLRLRNFFKAAQRYSSGATASGASTENGRGQNIDLGSGSEEAEARRKEGYEWLFEN